MGHRPIGMSADYFKRLKMEFDLRTTEVAAPRLPEGYQFRAWHPVLLSRHVTVKSAAFRGEPDCRLFPCLSTYDGCLDLMRSIVVHRAFLPAATWLIEFTGNEFGGDVPCASIQGMWDSATTGAIQNVGVIPEHRGFGLGRSLVLQSLVGFRQAGISRVTLNVTAENTPAVELYQSIGFCCVDVSYRSLAKLETV